MTEKLYDYDPCESLETQEAIEVFLESAFETGNESYIAKALGVVARSKGMSQISQEAGLSREQLYRSLSEQGNPTLKTLLSVLKTMGLKLTTRTIRDSEFEAVPRQVEG